MSALKSAALTVCCVCVAVSVISVLIPQKRTRRILGFVAGLFFISTLLNGIALHPENLNFEEITSGDYGIPQYSEDDMTAAAAQLTADNLTSALDELLRNEGIMADDIQITLKISDDGRIYASRAVIYINEEYEPRRGDIESIVYRNLSKEPEIYVTGQEAQRYS